VWAHDLKLQRAGQHLKELEGEIDGWVKGDGYSIRIEPDPDPQHREYEIKAYILREITEDPFSLLIGDFLQNARAALDYIAFALCEAGAEGGLSDETALNVGFPVVGDVDREGFSGRGGDRFDQLASQKIPTVTKPVRTAIEESQPYYTGGEFWAYEPLWVLHELARFDRHRFLHPAVVHTGEVRLDPAVTRNVRVRDFRFTWGERVIEEPDWGEHGAPSGAVLATFTALPADPKKEMQMRPLADLILGFSIDALPPTVPSLAGDEVWLVLWRVERVVKDLLGKLAPHLSASP